MGPFSLLEIPQDVLDSARLTMPELKLELAKWIPVKNAPSVPDRTAYDFDFATYTYRRK